MAAVAPRKRSNIGVAISPTRVVAWLPRDSAAGLGEEWSEYIQPLAPTATEWPELASALRALSAESGGGSLFIALLPPLAQVCAIDLPPVDEDDAVRIVSRNASKYFVGAREAQVVSVHAFEARKGEINSRALAGAVPARVVQAVRDAAESAGWKVGRLLPAQSAWISAAELVWAKSESLVDHGRVVVLSEDRIEILFKKDGRPDTFRHLRGLDKDQDRLLKLIAPGAGHAVAAASGARRNGVLPVAIIGDENIRRLLSPVLREAGLLPMEPDGIWRRVLNSPELSAAHFAPLTEELELVTEETRTVREQSMRKLAVRFGVAAAVLVLGGFVATYFGMKKELASLRQQRSEISTAVNEVRDAQAKIGMLGAPIAAIDSIRSAGVKWSVVVSDLAVFLPRDAYLGGMRAKGDSLQFEGQGRDASDVLAQLRRVPSLSNVRQSGEVTRQMDENGRGIDRFSLMARIKRDSVGGNLP